MPGLGDREASRARMVLGFDGSCSTCAELAERIQDQLAGELEVLSLHEPQAREWRRESLGEGAPLVPTLFEVRGTEAVRAWTGWRMGARLGRSLGPSAAWQVVQALGETNRTVGPLTGTAGGLTRGQFLKGVGGAVVAVSALSSSVGGFVSPAVAQGAGPAARARDAAVGASILRPEGWLVERERYTFNETYGFTLWRPEEGSSHDHGGTPAVRVALAYGLKPGQIEQTVRARIAEYPDLPVKREKVSIGGRGFGGVAVGIIPGSTPSTEVYVPVGDRVYQINIYGEGLGGNLGKLLPSLTFETPVRPVESLGLPDAGAPEVFRANPDQKLVEAERSAKEAERSELSRQAIPSEMSAQSTGEVRLNGGCYRAASDFFFQTQHGKYANKRWGADYTGWAQIGIPNYWGQYTHGRLGYGRCNVPHYTNDEYAIDYPLGRGDVIFCPFKRGTVTFAGRNYTHKDYGILVSIKADNGKYVSLSAHLSGLASGIRRGARVTDATIIGYAGNTGGPDIPVGETHLHQAYYRYPSYNSDGSPYGGAGLQVIYHRYVGTAAGTGPGVYKFGRESNSTTWAKGDWISN